MAGIIKLGLSSHVIKGPLKKKKKNYYSLHASLYIPLVDFSLTLSSISLNPIPYFQCGLDPC
jgi:hypothetical protein